MAIELDIPDIKVLVRTDPNYNVVIQNPRSAVYRSGSYVSVAELAASAVSSSYALSASYAGTASVATGLDVVFAGTFQTGSEGVIIPAPSGGYTYISTASYALSASYIINNTWNNVTDKPAGLISSSVQVYYLPVESASFASTASYAPTDVRTSVENRRFPITFLSASHITKDVIEEHLGYDPYTQTLSVSGGQAANAGRVTISTVAVAINSSSNNTVINHHGMYSSEGSKLMGLTVCPVDINPSLAGYNNPGIFLTSGSNTFTAYMPLEFQSSGSYTDGRVTANTKLVAKEGIEVTGSLNVTGGIVGSLIGTASFATSASWAPMAQGVYSASAQISQSGFVSSSTINTIQTITSASYAAITPVSGTLYIIIN